MNLRLIILLWGLILISCQQSENNAQEIAALKSKADSIATASQQVLLQNVAKAISGGGVEYAVDFCHIEVIPITDSLSDQFQASIRRISDRNRNPENNLKTKNDHAIFDQFKRQPKLSDTLLSENGQYVYYKRINLAMPTCMKCHGNPTVDIAEKTLQKITALYPNDKAVGYSLNEFRGLWKIEISNAK